MGDCCIYPTELKRKAHPSITNTPFVKAYLFVYNSLHAIGWTYVLFLFMVNAAQTNITNSLRILFQETTNVVTFLQLLVFIEILHDHYGIVSAADMNYFVRLHCKVFRRFHIYFIGLYFIPEVQQSTLTGYMLIVWGILDLIRYPFYALNVYKRVPEWLNTLRYNEFLILYPIVFIIETLLWYEMLPYIDQMELHNLVLPSGVTLFSYYYFVIAYVIYRACSFPINFRRMMRMKNNRVFKKSKEM